MQPLIHSQYHYKLGLKFAGGKSVGKTSIFYRLSDMQTPKPWKFEYPALIGINTHLFKTKVDDKPVLVYIQDYNAFSDEIYLFSPHYIKFSNGIMLIYDVTNRDSFIILPDLFNKIFQSAPEEVCVLLVGNKIDEEENRQVSYEEGRLLAENLNINFIEVSAKNRDGLDFAYKMMLKDMYNTVKMNEEDLTDIVKICKKRKEKTTSCCFH